MSKAVMDRAALLALANEAAEIATVDMSQTSTGGGSKIVLSEGHYLGRLVEYVEIGHRPNTFKGATGTRPEVRIGVALWYTDDLLHGAPLPDPDAVADQPEQELQGPVVLRTFGLNMSNNEKSKLKLAFDRMNYGRDKASKRSMAQFLGQPFLFKVTVTESKTKKGEFHNNLVLHEVMPPFDLRTRKPIPVPAVEDDLYKLFLWDMPTQETWDSLYIDGVRDDGKSKNWRQEEILKATNFQGSPLQQMLGGAGALPSLEVADDDDTPPFEVDAPAEAVDLSGMAEDLPPLDDEFDDIPY